MQLVIAVLAGAFIWIQREMRHNNDDDSTGFIGIRSSIFLSVLWVTSTFVPTLPYLPVILFSAAFILLAISHAAWAFNQNRPWITSELIGVMIFWIWALVWFGMETLAIILAVVLAAVNTFREHIDSFIDALSHKEWLAALQLGVFSGAVLPILPNMPITELIAGTNFALEASKEWEALTFMWLMYAILSDINLFKVWLFVLFISWISFVGYFLSKFIWAKWWIPIAAFLWALSSSTAVTLSLASQEKDSFKVSGSKLASLIFVAWILIGIATMMLRVILGVFVIGGTSMGTGIFLIPLSMSITATVMAVYYMMKHNKEQKQTAEKAEIKLSSPFEIWPAIQFAGFYVMISVLMNSALYYQGWIAEKIEWLSSNFSIFSWLSENLPMYVISFISGFADVDAVYIKVSDLVKDWELLAGVWVITITIAVIMNTVVKIFYIRLGASKYLGGMMTMLIGIICLMWMVVTFGVV